MSATLAEETHVPAAVPRSALYAVIDTETTGTDPKTDRVVEIGCTLYQAGKLIGTFNTLVNPERHIPAGASGIHHLLDRHVADAPKFPEALASLKKFIEPASIYVAHNAVFDSAMLPELNDKRWLCTMRLAQHLWPDADNFKNQTLRYFLELEDKDFDGISSHRAVADCLVTGGILLKGLNRIREVHGPQTLPWLVKFADAPVLMTKMPRGSVGTKGKAWEDISIKDLQYWAGRGDNDRDLQWNIERALLEARKNLFERRSVAAPSR